jgi:hypothetical protein
LGPRAHLSALGVAQPRASPRDHSLRYILTKADAKDEPALSTIGQDVLLNWAFDVIDLSRWLASRFHTRGRPRAEPASRTHPLPDGKPDKKQIPGPDAPLEQGSDGPQHKQISVRRLSHAATAGLFRRKSSATARRGPNAVLSMERAQLLIQALAEEHSALDDVHISRYLARKRGTLLAKGMHLSLSELTELLGAVTATRVMRKYGAEVRESAADTGHALSPSRFDVGMARALMRIGRGVEQANAQGHQRLAEQARLTGMVDEVRGHAARMTVMTEQTGVSSSAAASQMLRLSHSYHALAGGEARAASEAARSRVDLETVLLGAEASSIAPSEARRRGATSAAAAAQYAGASCAPASATEGYASSASALAPLPAGSDAQGGGGCDRVVPLALPNAI